MPLICPWCPLICPWCPRSPHARAELRATRAVVRSARCRARARRNRGMPRGTACQAHEARPGCSWPRSRRRSGGAARPIELDEREDGEGADERGRTRATRARRDRDGVELETRRLRCVYRRCLASNERARAWRRGRASVASTRTATPASAFPRRTARPRRYGHRPWRGSPAREAESIQMEAAGAKPHAAAAPYAMAAASGRRQGAAGVGRGRSRIGAHSLDARPEERSCARP